MNRTAKHLVRSSNSLRTRNNEDALPKADPVSDRVSRRRRVVVAALLSAGLTIARATTLDVTNNLSLPAGEHEFDTVIVRSNATLTLQGNPATGQGGTIVATNVMVEAGGAISATGQGYPFQQGPGRSTNANAGASHGGRGGWVAATDALYGSATHPVTLGSGGDPQAGAGGGAIHLVISGVLQLDGVIEADTSGNGHTGGSVFVETGTLLGSGSIHANGGRGVCSSCTAYFPGGGGGRIAIYYQTNQFTGTVQARGGLDSKGTISSAAGEAGTVGWFDVSNPSQVRFTAGHSWRFQSSDAVSGEISFHDVDLVDTTTSVEAGVSLVRAERDFLIRGTETNSSWLGLYAPSGTLSIAATALTLQTNCAIDVSGKGFPSQQGPGTSTNANLGGSHGGRGGQVTATSAVYGSAIRPLTWGSGGEPVEGSGGGALHLVVSNLLCLDGTLNADANGNGHAGGSIFIEAGTVAGGGVLHANGSRGVCGSCTTVFPGGGGGRIAVHFRTNVFGGEAWARGGPNSKGNYAGAHGEDGTVGWFDVSNPAQVRFAAGHAWRFQASDASGGEVEFYDILIHDSVATVEEGVSLVRALNDLVLSRSVETNVASVELFGARGTLQLAARNLTVSTGCVVTVTGKGFGEGEGPGASAPETGAGHGGRGGSSFGPGGPTYGSERYPDAWGSSCEIGGTRGGGALRLAVDAVLRMDGVLSADAVRGSSGGSSGGSILIEARRIEGNGTIQANGGRGGCTSCTEARGGGGGGRVAIHFAENAYQGTAQALGGPDNKGNTTTASTGENGTVVWVREIPIGVGGSLAIAHEPLVHYTFRLDWPGSGEKVVLVRLTPTGAGGEWLLNGQFAQPPASQSATWTGLALAGSPVHEMLVPLSAAGAYYFDAFNQAWPTNGAGSFALEVQEVSRYVPPISLGRGGNQGTSTLLVPGAGFEPGMTVELRDAGGNVLRSFNATPTADLGLSVAANLQGLAPGVVNVAIVWPDLQTVLLTGAFEITGDPPGQLEITTELPASVRALRPYTLWVTCANTGGSDLPAPLLRIVSEDNLAMRLSSADPFRRRELYVIAIRDTEPFDVIPPRQSIRFPVQYIPEGGAHHLTAIRIETLIGASQNIDWEATKQASIPAGLATAAWEQIWSQFLTHMGQTTEDFAARMRADAVQLAELQNPTRSLGRLLTMELVAAAGGTGMTEPRFAEVDIAATSETPELVFARYASDTLFSRYESGSLGFGWTHSYDCQLEQLASDRVQVRLPGRYLRPFYLSPKNEWQPARGDYGRLIETSAGFDLHDGRQVMRFATNGTLTSLELANGRKLTLTYSNGKLVSVAHSSGGSLSLTYNGDLLESVTDPAARVTRYFYDAGHLVEVARPGGSTNRYQYALSGPAMHALTAVSLAGGNWREFEHDTMGRLSGQSWQDGNAAVTYVYPAFGAVESVDGSGRHVRVDFDADDNPLLVRAPNGDATAFLYREEERRQTMLLPDSGTIAMRYDAFGHLTELTDPLGRTLRAEFSPQWGRLQWIEDPLGIRTSLAYDSVGELKTISHPDGREQKLTRDSAGRITQVTWRSGQVIAYSRDANGRLIEERISGIATNTFVRDAVGRVQEVADDLGTNTFAYDARDRLAAVNYSDIGALVFERDAAGRRVRISDGPGFALRYVYDAKGRLIELREDDDSLIVSYTYDAAGKLIRETRRNQTATAYDYDLNGRLRTISHLGPADVLQERFGYQYDAHGKCVAVTNLVGDVTRYAYDAAGQLTRVDHPSGEFEAFTYDLAGNRRTRTTASGTTSYDVGSFNQYKTVGGGSLSYNADGALTNEVGQAYAYDAKARLIAHAPLDGDGFTYQYDAFGARRQATRNGETNRFLNDPSGLGWVFTERDGNGQLRSRSVLGLHLTAWVNAAGEWFYYGFDRCGHTRLVTDAAGQVVNRYDYDPFGQPRSVQEQATNAYRFGGAYGARTEDSGLIFMRHRYYHPGLGRFLTPDPSGLAGGLNAYAFTGNDPVNRTDPSGLVWWEDGVDFLFDEPEEVITDWLGPSDLQEQVVDQFVEDAVDWSRLPPEDVQKLQEMNTIGNVGYEVLGDDYRLFDKQTRENAENGLKQTVKDVINGVLGVLTGDTLVDVVKDSVKDTLKDSLDAPPEPVLDPSIWELAHKPISELVTPGDPNEKVGWSEAGWPGITTATQALHYVIYFENNPMIATAPAQEVVIEDTLDVNLDWSTFRLEEIAWGDTIVPLPANASALNTRVTIQDYRGSVDKTWWVDVAAGVDANGTARWTFRTLDPLTGDLPEDAFAGFLPVNDATGRGQGHVSFSIRPRATATLGSQLANRAVIRFDTEAPIQTGVVIFTIGDRPPLVLETFSLSGTNFTFAFQSEPGQGYTVEYNDELGTTNWLFHHVMTGDGSLQPVLIPMTNGPQRFFRVRQP